MLFCPFYGVTPSGAALSTTLGGVALGAPAAALDPSPAFVAIGNGSATVFDAKTYAIPAGAASVTLAVTIDSSKLPTEWTTLAADGVTQVTAVRELLDLVILV